MKVKELIEELKKCNQEAEVLINSYWVEEDYDWDENLKLNYIEEVISPIISEEKDIVFLN